MNLERLQRLMKKYPSACIVSTEKRSICGLFWTDKDIPDDVLYQNLLGGIAHQIVNGGRMTKAQVLEFLQGLLHESAEAQA